MIKGFYLNLIQPINFMNVMKPFLVQLGQAVLGIELRIQSFDAGLEFQIYHLFFIFKNNNYLPFNPISILNMSII